MSGGSTKRGKPGVPVRLELKQLKRGSKPQAGSEKHEQNFNSQEAVLGAVNLLDAGYERCSASSRRDPDGYLRDEGPDHGGRAVRLSAGLAIVARLRSARSFTRDKYPQPNWS